MPDLLKNRNPEDVRELGCMITAFGYFVLFFGFIICTFQYQEYKKEAEGYSITYKYEPITFKATIKDWQHYKHYLDKGDRIELDGIGNVVLNFEFTENKVKLVRLEKYKFITPTDGKAMIKFPYIDEESYCNFQVAPVELVKIEKIRDLLFYGQIGIPLFFIIFVFPIAKRLRKYKSIEEKRDRVKRKIGLE